MVLDCWLLLFKSFFEKNLSRSPSLRAQERLKAWNKGLFVNLTDLLQTTTKTHSYLLHVALYKNK